ncbi:MAG TPA: hypothetical protein VKF42_05030 [Chitinivibrionales bacterium]|jgi:hypothetical protein|nr:hypothetical protein [Chitinivibrionales bacterium]
MPSSHITIPPSEIRALKKIVELGEEKREQLLHLLSNIEPAMTPQKIVEQIVGKIDVPADNLYEIMCTVFDLYYNASQASTEIGDFITQAVDSLNRAKVSSELKIDKEHQEVLTQFLKKLTALDRTIGISAKSISVAVGNAKLFRSARIYTDIRPCFPADFNKEFLGGVILHQLELNYQERNSQSQIYVTLDASDIANLKSQLIRAEEKEKLLRSKRSFSNFSFINQDVSPD